MKCQRENVIFLCYSMRVCTCFKVMIAKRERGREKMAMGVGAER